MDNCLTALQKKHYPHICPIDNVSSLVSGSLSSISLGSCSGTAKQSSSTSCIQTKGTVVYP